LFGSHSHSGIPGFLFWLFCSQEQNSRNIFLIWNIPNERALGCNLLLLKIIGAEPSSLCINYTAYIKLKGAWNQAFIDFWKNFEVARIEIPTSDCYRLLWF